MGTTESTTAATSLEGVPLLPETPHTIPTTSTVLVTGAAGFIGYHLTMRLLADGHTVIGIDNLNSYYSVKLKETRLRQIGDPSSFRFYRADLTDDAALSSIFEHHRPQIVVNLAAQAGVRYSIDNPSVYIQSNLVGFANVLEACRHHGVEHLLYASSSSIYGGSTKVPFDEGDRADHPVSLYAATKRSNELMADCYAHLYGLPATGMRFFTVYGPYGRPDMAYYSFADSYFAGRSIKVYNGGDTQNDLSRDFTYVDDVVECIARLLHLPPAGAPPHEVYNVGGSRPESLTNFITTLEDALGKALGHAVIFDKVYETIKPGDVKATHANTARLDQRISYTPRVPLDEGLHMFADWYVRFNNLN